jgi:PAS domain S-box-containing protein/putative nucleotidyltransferase with HDIG domain
MPQEHEASSPDGRFWLVRGYPVTGPGGAVSGAIEVTQDITERKRVEEALAEEVTQRRILMDTSRDGISILDEDSKLCEANQRFAEMLGYSPEELKDFHTWDWDIQWTREKLLEMGRSVDAAGVHLETRHRRKDGTVFDVELSVNSAVVEGKKLLFCVSRDVTERRQAEEALRLSEQNFRDSIENSPLGIRIADKDGKTLYANRALLDIWGYSSLEELEAVPAKQRYAPESYAEHMTRLNKRKRGEHAPSNYEISIVRSDGQVRYISASRGELLWGGEKRFQIVYQDITERKQAEAEYRSIIRAAMDCFWLTDMQGNFLDVNEAYCRLVGYSRDELLNMSIKDIEEIEKPEDIAERIRKIEEVGYDRFETRHRRKDGGIVDVEISVNYLSTGGGRMFIFLRDITERKRMEEELRQNVERFKKAMEGVIQLIATIVEVRDPYTAGHQRRVAELACAIAEEMGFSEERIEEIRMASLIHDIGKIYVPAEILSKPSRLTEIEFSMIKSHPQVAYDILKSVEFPWPICKVVLQHHERMDSSGYPGGLAGEDILPGARIIAVADVVEAMASHRPYRPALGLDKALEEISQKRGILYDTEAVDACLRVFNERGFKL